MSDQKVLAKIVRTEADQGVRRVALEKLVDQEAITEIARTNTNAGVRCDAVERIVDQRVAAQIAQNDRDVDVQRSAVLRVTDETYLAEIARSDSPSDVRKLAVIRLKADQRLLTEIVENDRDPVVRRAAVRNLTDLGVLSEMAGAHPDPRIRDAAASVLVDLLEDQTALGNLARTVSDAMVRIEAIRKLTSREMLAEIAEQDETMAAQVAKRLEVLDLTPHASSSAELSSAIGALEWEQFGSAITELKNVTTDALLARLALRAAHSHVRIMAASRVSDATLARAMFDSMGCPDAIGSDGVNPSPTEIVTRMVDAKLLARIAQAVDGYGDLCRMAIKNSHLTDRDVLLDLARGRQDTREERCSPYSSERCGLRAPLLAMFRLKELPGPLEPWIAAALDEYEEELERENRVRAYRD